MLPEGFELSEFSVAQTHVNTTTILVAFAAGVAGMLAVETRASSAVGVAISVTTIPATAYLGVALGIGEFRTSLSALAVLAANVAMMLAGGTLALVVQRALGASKARAALPALALDAFSSPEKNSSVVFVFVCGSGERSRPRPSRYERASTAVWNASAGRHFVESSSTRVPSGISHSSTTIRRPSSGTWTFSLSANVGPSTVRSLSSMPSGAWLA